MSQDPASLGTSALIDAVCDRFEQACRQGKSPRIEDFLGEVPPEHQDRLLAELIALVQAYQPEVPREELIENLESRFPQQLSVIHRVLSSEQAGKTVVSAAAQQDSSHLQPAAETRDQEPTLPETIGRYRVAEVLGEGAFGLVVRAEDEQLQRSVAIKVRRPGTFAGGESAIDFLAEARRAAKLEHPHIVPVYDSGQLEDGSCYIVSKLIDGGSVTDLTGQRRLEVSETVELVAGIAEALQAAHSEGMVHRDVKPANILVDRQRRPYLTDFGLALHEDEQLDRRGEISGSPPYMSPEQVRGEAAHLDGRTDIWSLGVILYELLTGRRPFRGRTFHELGEAITQHDPKPPRMVEPSLPSELEQIVLRCLEKDVRSRYQTAGDLAMALRAWLHNQSQLGSPQGSIAGEPEQGSIRAHRTWVAVMVVLGVGAVWIAAARLLVEGRPEASKSVSSTEGETDAERASPGIDSAAAASAKRIGARLNVRIWNDQIPRRKGLSIADPQALPLQPGDAIRVEAQLDRPAYAYLLWISSTGEVDPVYPWRAGDWSARPLSELPVERVSLPEVVDQAWPLSGPAGMESLVLLVRPSPLPKDVDLPGLLSGLPPQDFQQAQSVVWFQNGKPVLEDAVPQATLATSRRPQFFNAQRVDDPVLNTQAELYRRLSEHFTLIQGASFANAGEE